MAGMTVQDLVTSTLELLGVSKQVIEALVEVCDKKMLKKTVMISQDDEGNSFHTLYYGMGYCLKFNKELVESSMLHDDGFKPSDFVVLG